MQTSRTTLQLLQQSDFTALLAMFAEPDAFKYIKPHQNKSEDEYIAFLQLKMEQIATGKGFYWTVRCQDSNALIGAINLTPIPKTDKMQLGWMICAAFRRQGFGFESAKAALDFAIAETQIDPIYAVFVRENVASQRILERLGFNAFDVVDDGEEVLLRYMYCPEKS